MNRSPVRVRLSAQKKACKYLTYRLSFYPPPPPRTASHPKRTPIPNSLAHPQQHSSRRKTSASSTLALHAIMNRPTADSCCHHPPSSCLWAASIRARSQHRYTYLARQPSLKKNKQEIQISVHHITTDGTQATDTLPTLSVTSKLAVIHLRAVSQQSARHHIYVKTLGLARNVFLLIPMCGQRWIRTTEGERQQIYSLPHLATLEFALPLLMVQR